jgi:hypothetical protein
MDRRQTSSRQQQTEYGSSEHPAERDELQDEHGDTPSFADERAYDSDGSGPTHAGHALPTALPRLLHVPGPSFLHIYARLLGYLGDHAGLLELAYWIREHHREISARAERDRKGNDMLRKFACAMRVFLERSWLNEPPPRPSSMDEAVNDAPVSSSRRGFFSVSQFFDFSAKWKEDASSVGEDSSSLIEDTVVATNTAKATGAKVKSRASAGLGVLSLLARLEAPADPELIAQVRAIWDDPELAACCGGWPTDREVRLYVSRMRT